MNFEVYKEKVDELNNYSRAYHFEDNSLISDIEYDRLFKELIEIENKNPDWILPYSPSLKVGGDVLDAFEKYEHTKPLLSLENVFSKDELREFFEKIKSEIGYLPKITGEYKIDGLSASLIYKDGIFEIGATRGNSLIGENVSQNIRTISKLPLKLKKEESLNVRAEVFIKNKDFIEINKRRKENEETEYANPRNLAAGSIRQLDSKIVSSRNLDYMVFDILDTENHEIKDHISAISYLKSLGFSVNEARLFDSFTEINKFIDEIEASRDKLGFMIDGLVFKINDFDLRKKLGEKTRYPKWAIAYKFNAEKVITKIVNIELQVGRTGQITPRAKFEEIFLAGSNIKYASLHNFDYIKEKDIRIGDYVEIEKSGEIIPQVIRVIFDKREKNTPEYTEPKYCPSCESELVHSDLEVALKCINKKCEAKTIRNLVYFCSNSGMDIDGFGEKLVELLYDEKIIKDFKDIYKIQNHKEKFLNIKSLGIKRYENLISSIEKSKQNSLEKLLAALGLENIGDRSAKIIASKFKNMDNLFHASYQDFLDTDNIGSKTADILYEYFKDEENKNMILQLKELGINLDYIEKNSVKSIFTDKSLVITGTFKNFTRAELKKKLEELGGKFKTSVTSKTDFLIMGEKAGSKHKKALELNIKIISEDDINEILN